MHHDNAFNLGFRGLGMAGDGGSADAGEEMEKSGGDHNLARRPCELSAADKVDVQVRHGFATVRPVIDHGSETGFSQTNIPGNFSSGKQKMPENFLISRSCLPNSRDGFAGNNQDVRGCLGGNISEGTTDLIAVDDVCRDFTIVNFFKKRFHVGGRIAAKAGIASPGNEQGFDSSALQRRGKTI
jgi:hypothetical protein